MATAEPLRMSSSPEERVRHAEHETEKYERRREMQRRAIYIVAFILLCASLTMGAAALRETQAAAESAAESAKSADLVADFVADCTTPGGECYEESQQQQRETQGAQNEITYLANACADKPGTQSERDIRLCVAHALLSEKDPRGD